jgi:hypothetical protein
VRETERGEPEMAQVRSRDERGRVVTSRRAPTSRFIGLVGVVVAASALLAAGGSSATPDATKRPAARNFPGGPYFTVVCGFSHRNNDDPIRFPGQPGRSHNHTYIGNRDVDASTTPATLRGGDTTCDIDRDASTYWVPTVFLLQEPITPLAAVVYYTKRTTDPVVAPPVGLKMLAGNPAAHHHQPREVASWSCGGVGGQKRFAAIPACRSDDALELNVRFPNCWNGRTTDSPNHRRHMAYSTEAGACPASHPVRLPTITIVLLYPSLPKGARPASGTFAAHADFMNGWEQDQLERMTALLNSSR